MNTPRDFQREKLAHSGERNNQFHGHLICSVPVFFVKVNSASSSSSLILLTNLGCCQKVIVGQVKQVGKRLWWNSPLIPRQESEDGRFLSNKPLGTEPATAATADGLGLGLGNGGIHMDG